MTNGGYDNGYASCPCFWGQEPGSLIVELFTLLPSLSGLTVLDAGCGEGKNAHAVAGRGAKVVAVDCSELALANGRHAFPHDPIDWQCCDVGEADYGIEKFDLVIAYGFFHCLDSEQNIAKVIQRLQNATRLGGLHIVCAFNSRAQDLTAHPGFNPCLISHSQYVKFYDGWEILRSSDTDLHEVHPHNLIPHSHSMTRFIARKPQ